MNKLFKDKNFSLKSTINILILGALISGFLGFILETIVFYIKEGYFVKRGSSFGPIIPIYSCGAILIIFASYRFKNKPLLLFIINVILTGLLEYAVGYVLVNIFHKIAWDYHNEFLNINGLICLKSVVTFGIGSLLLIYVVLPFLFKLVEKVSEKVITIISYSLGSIYILDIILYILIK